MHLFLSLNHSLVLKERLLGLKPTHSSSPMNLFFLGEEEIKRLSGACFHAG